MSGGGCRGDVVKEFVCLVCVHGVCLCVCVCLSVCVCVCVYVQVDCEQHICSSLAQGKSQPGEDNTVNYSLNPTLSCTTQMVMLQNNLVLMDKLQLEVGFCCM